MTTSGPDFGTCWGTPGGVDVSMPAYMASGLQVVAEAIVRRWSTTNGRLIDDPTYGENLTDLIGADLRPADISAAQQRAGGQAQLDERVLRCTVTLTLDTTGLLTVAANVVTAAGPFSLVVTNVGTDAQTLLVNP